MVSYLKRISTIQSCPKIFLRMIFLIISKRINPFKSIMQVFWLLWDDLCRTYLKSLLCSNYTKILRRQTSDTIFDELRFDFELTRANILSWTSLLSMEAILAELLREETRQITQPSIEGSSNNPLALAAQPNKRRNLSKLQWFECKVLVTQYLLVERKNFALTARNMSIS